MESSSGNCSKKSQLSQLVSAVVSLTVRQFDCLTVRLAFCRVDNKTKLLNCSAAPVVVYGPSQKAIIEMCSNLKCHKTKTKKLKKECPAGELPSQRLPVIKDSKKTWEIECRYSLYILSAGLQVMLESLRSLMLRDVSISLLSI